MRQMLVSSVHVLAGEMSWASGRRSTRAYIFSIDRGGCFFRTEAEISSDMDVTLSIEGVGHVELDVSVSHVTSVAPDGRVGVHAHLNCIRSSESALGLRSFIRAFLGEKLSGRPEKKGKYWWHAFTESGVPEGLVGPANERGPAVQVAGKRADTAEAPPLNTGRDATTVETLREWCSRVEGAKMGVYVNAPCAYIVSGARYWGRALKLSDRWLHINTNAVVPGLGVRIRCDLTCELDGVKRAVSIKGIMNRKMDPPAGGIYSGSFLVRVSDLLEGDSPGLLIYYLDRVMADKRSHAPSEAGPSDAV